MRKQVIRCFALCILCALLFTGCGQQVQDSPATQAPAETTVPADESTVFVTESPLPGYTAQEVSELLGASEACPESMRDAAFLEWCDALTGGDVLFRTMVQVLQEEGYSDDIWMRLTGRSKRVLCDLYCADELPDNVTVMNQDPGGAVDLAFFGDINMSQDQYCMLQAAEKGIDPIDCIAPSLVRELNRADIAMCNFECTFSIRGYPYIAKHPNFRCHPSGVSFLQELGVDIVTLANNHIYDYTTNALVDTLTTLDDAGIGHVGAGADIDQAQTEQYYIVNGVKIAFISASRAEVYVRTPAAKENRAGVFAAYDPERFLAAIARAESNADYVVAVIHAGNETRTDLEEGQVTLAHQCIDSGADLVVGSHPQNAEGFAFYRGCPIAYSVGNFWYSEVNTECMVLHAQIDARGISLRVNPCVLENGMTRSVAGELAGYQLLNRLKIESPGINVDAEGRITETQTAAQENTAAS